MLSEKWWGRNQRRAEVFIAKSRYIAEEGNVGGYADKGHLYITYF